MGQRGPTSSELWEEARITPETCRPWGLRSKLVGGQLSESRNVASTACVPRSLHRICGHGREQIVCVRQFSCGRAHVPPDPRHRPRTRPTQQRGDPLPQPAAAHPRPHAARPVGQCGRPAGPNRPIQCRTVDGRQPGSAAICAGFSQRADSSTIAARSPCRHGPRRQARDCPVCRAGCWRTRRPAAY
jgi:hypothetical protein